MFYLTVSEVAEINEQVLAEEAQQSLLADEGKLESAIIRPQMAAHYEEANLVRQTALLVSGIALAHAFVDGKKRAPRWLRAGRFCASMGIPWSGSRWSLLRLFSPWSIALEAWIQAHLRLNP
jgi:hypothetical protein